MREIIFVNVWFRVVNLTKKRVFVIFMCRYAMFIVSFRYGFNKCVVFDSYAGLFGS